MADELKPCPFCGSRAEMDTRQPFRSIFDGKMLEQVCIYCTSCSASVSHYPGDLSFSREDTIDLCVDEWNTRAAAMSDLIAGDADMYDTPSARITGDKDRENPVEGVQHKPAVTQADVEIAEEIGQHMASYYEWGRPSDYQLAKESAAMARELIAAQVEREIVAWLRSVAATYDRIDDGLSGLDKMSQGITEAADAIEQGQYRNKGETQ